ncbi:MAG: hypothetical protein ACR2GW_07055 [Pyrinomonadaceae bacterium]|jgi:hypothetical protein
MAKKAEVIRVAQPRSTANPSGIREYSLEEVARMPLPVYLRKADKILNARKQVYHDTVRLEGGTPWTVGQRARVFNKGIGQPANVTNTGAAYEKTDFDTNMISDGEFEGGTTAIVSAIEVDLFLCARVPTADTLGMITNPAPAAKVANTYSASILFFALTRQTKLTFFRSETPQENGFLYEFPTRFGATSSLGGDAEEGFVQNTTGRGNVLDFPKILESDDKFSALLEPLAPSLALPIDVAIRVLMITKRIGTLYV